jgi:ABC-type glycerol-3-phosphate transport system permease component
LKRAQTQIKNYPISILKHMIFALWAIVTIFPVLFMLINSLKDKQEYMVNKFWIPANFTLVNLKNIIFMQNFGRWYLNSLIITIASVAVSLILAIFAAYGLTRHDFKLKRLLTNFLISLMVVPPVVMIIPLFILMVKVRLINTYYSVIIIYSGLILPFSIYLLMGFFKTIPHSIIESAYVDGASSMRILRSIIIPMSLPSIGTLVVVNAIWVWNELLIALVFMQKENMRTIIGGLSQFVTKYQLEVPLLMMGLTIATIPIMLLYFFTQQFFVKGLTAGALKE